MDTKTSLKPDSQISNPNPCTSNKNKIWKASELETIVLKHHFQSNQSPTLEDKKTMLKIFKENFDSEVRVDQLERWFKNERDKAFKRTALKPFPKTYIKFSKEEQESLEKSFAIDNYPSVRNMTVRANEMKVSFSKIENWYKHKRRLLAKQGDIVLKTKKYFKMEELSYLTDSFNKNSRPAQIKIREMAERIGCNGYQIKNWFSNRRKRINRQKKEAHPQKESINLQNTPVCESIEQFSSEDNHIPLTSSLDEKPNFTNKYPILNEKRPFVESLGQIDNKFYQIKEEENFSQPGTLQQLNTFTAQSQDLQIMHPREKFTQNRLETTKNIQLSAHLFHIRIPIQDFPIIFSQRLVSNSDNLNAYFSQDNSPRDNQFRMVSNVLTTRFAPPTNILPPIIFHPTCTINNSQKEFYFPKF